ncbi:unnamed protein product [Eruca vesicaria subsp. sativa]|uniref:Uncharacterized protein n=1 Tax=Eruca vesicaria subsp. sativa TaxID=29727 RepID=A0ABC8LY07_ERUVS|nr:unnamed protein product [Eruca vesicaria subsp. sativa]
MANLLHLQLSSPSTSLASSFRRRHSTLNREIDLWRTFLSRRGGSVQCRAGRFRFRTEDELFRDGGFDFGYRKKKKKKPWWWLDDDDDDDDDDGLMNDEEDWSMVFEVFRSLSWMLAPIGISLILGTDSDAGLMALAVPLVQSLVSLVFSKVLSRPSVGRPIERSRTFSRRRKGRRGGEMDVGGVDKGGYKSWIVGDADDNSIGSRYGGWDDLENGNEILFEESVRSKEQFKRRNGTRRWRVKEKPLLLRMLFASFPFLSSWTKLLF